MQIVPLQSLANQQLAFIVDNNQWDITLKATNGVMSATILLNSVLLIENLRCVAGTYLLPAEYLESGNFVFTTLNGQLPDYTQFGTSQQLFYLTQAEMDAMRVPPAFPLTSADFNPAGDLPLRFAPQGYTVAP